MNYEEWKKRKIELEKLSTGNSTRIEYNHPIYDVFFVLNRLCFNKMFQLIHFYWMSPEVIKGRPNVLGLYITDRILLLKAYYDEHGIDEDMINLVFHEMVHGYCQYKGIEDMTGAEHNEAFYKSAKCCGGTDKAELKKNVMEIVIKQLNNKKEKA